MPFLIDDLIIFGVPALLALGTAKVARGPSDGAAGPPPASYAPQPYAYGGMPAYPIPQQPYVAQEAYQPQLYDGFNPATGEAVAYKEDGQFTTTASYSSVNIPMKVDTGADICVIGDDAYSWLRDAIGNEMRQSEIFLADGRTVEAWHFTFPYLTVGSISLPEVQSCYIPGRRSGLLGMSFLGRCHIEMHGNQMILRG